MKTSNFYFKRLLL